MYCTCTNMIILNTYPYKAETASNIWMDNHLRLYITIVYDFSLFGSSHYFMTVMLNVISNLLILINNQFSIIFDCFFRWYYHWYSLVLRLLLTDGGSLVQPLIFRRKFYSRWFCHFQIEIWNWWGSDAGAHSIGIRSRNWYEGVLHVIEC